MQPAMLKGIIQQMQLGREFTLCQPAGLVPIRTNDNRHLQLARNQQWLVAKMLRRAVGVYDRDLGSPPPIAAGKNVECDPALFEQLSKGGDKRSLSAAAHRNVAHADYGTRELAHLEAALVVEGVSNDNARAEDVRKRIDGTWTGFSRSNGWRAARVRAVAPVFWRNSSRARWPSLWRSFVSPSSCRSIPGRLPVVTVVIAPLRSNKRTISRKLNVLGPTRIGTAY